MTDEQVNHNINESADKIRVQTKVKRGSGTRDQDEITVKVKGDDAGEVVEKLNDMLRLLHETAGELRGMQPEEGDE